MTRWARGSTPSPTGSLLVHARRRSVGDGTRAISIMRAEIALSEAAHGRGTAIKKTFVDGNRSCFVGAAISKRMDNPTAGAERD